MTNLVCDKDCPNPKLHFFLILEHSAQWYYDKGADSAHAL